MCERIYYGIFNYNFFSIPLLLNLHLIYSSARKEQLTIFKGYDTLKERRFVNSKSVRKSQCDRCFSVNERTAGKEITSADCISSFNTAVFLSRRIKRQ